MCTCLGATAQYTPRAAPDVCRWIFLVPQWSLEGGNGSGIMLSESHPNAHVFHSNSKHLHGFDRTPSTAQILNWLCEERKNTFASCRWDEKTSCALGSHAHLTLTSPCDITANTSMHTYFSIASSMDSMENGFFDVPLLQKCPTKRNTEASRLQYAIPFSFLAYFFSSWL